MPEPPRVDAIATVESKLDQLQRSSEERQAELREIAAQLPEAVSRRAILRKIAIDLWHAPEKGELASRGVRKLARLLGQGARSLKQYVVAARR